ncbi:MAG: hypothetical protein IPP60_06185 [Sphingobacteriales bacterium]|nr:hypothetical protein [Sphingobacteriales bacterium]MBP8192733.1 hypothetical protein [Chitinophagales bacterium]
MGLDLYHVIPSATIVFDDDYFTIDEFETNESFLNNYNQLLKTSIDEFGNKSLVLYFAEKGHQRKGMNNEFFKVFQNERLYFKISDVENAKKFINSEYDLNGQLFETFQRDFIDNFIEGESIFFASW